MNFVIIISLDSQGVTGSVIDVQRGIHIIGSLHDIYGYI